MSFLFAPPYMTILDDDGNPVSGGMLYFYATGTTTPVSVYADSGLVTPLANPVIADAAGRCAAVYLDSNVIYRCKTTTAGGATIRDVDPIIGGATGAGLVAFSHANAYAAATIGAKLKLFVNVKDAPYLAAGDGVADDSAAFQAALNDARAVFVPKGDYKINTPLVLPVTGATLASDEKARLFSTVNGKHIVSGVNVAGVTILGLRFEGANSATVPLAGFGGYAASTTGLVTLAGCSDVRVEGNEFNNFHNGLSVQNCDRLWVERNRARNFYVHGILASRSSDFAIERNFISGCTQAGGAAAYGIHATGDQAGGEAQLRGSISFNIIDGVPSWDGIMSHDCDGLRIVGNDIRNVRKGIDVGHLQATNVVKNVVIEGNLIVGTAANTWGAAGAETVGIAVAGYDAANRVDGVTVRGNIVRDFFGVAGMVGAGDPNGITVSNADSVCVSDNHVLGSGAVVNSAGIGIGGTVNNGLSLIGNNLQGSMGRGAIRLANVIAEAVVIVGNAMEQTVAATEGILITGSTITALQVNDNPTNSTAPFTQSTSVLTFTGQNLEAAVAYDPPNLVDGAGVTTTVAVAGAAVGDFAIASFGGDLAGMLLTAYVSAAGTVSVRFQNETGGALDLGNSTLRARVFKRLT